MNIQNIKSMIKDKEIKRLCKENIKLKNESEKIQKIVESYKNKILEENVFLDEEGNKVTECRYDWLMNEKDFSEYLKLLRVAHIENGFGHMIKEHEDMCPLLVSQDQLRKHNIVFANALEKYTGMKYENICSNLKVYKEYFELNRKLLDEKYV